MTIVFFQIGQAGPVKLAVLAAARSNPDADIILVADAPYCSHPQCEFVQVDTLVTEGYRSVVNAAMGPLKGAAMQALNRICFQRWFALRRLCESRKLTSLFTADSDVLLFAPLSEVAWRFAGYGATLSDNHAGMFHAGHMFINDVGLLDEFCQRTLAAIGCGDPLGSDMGAWTDLRKDRAMRFGETNVIWDDDSTFHHHMGFTEGWESSGGFQIIRFKEGKPYCNHAAKGPVLQRLLHCWCLDDRMGGLYGCNDFKA